MGVHDWGGAIGFGVAGRRPERVGKILVTNTGAFLSDRIPARIALCRAPLIGRFIVQGLNGFAWPATWMSVEKPLSPAAKAGFLAPYGSISVRRAVADFVAEGAGTRVTLTMVFITAEDCAQAKGFGAEALGLQTLGKLAAIIGAA